MGLRAFMFKKNLFFLQYKDKMVKPTNFRIMAPIVKFFADPAETRLSCIPVNADIELPEGTVAPDAIVEHFINAAAYHVSLSKCPCRTSLKCEHFPTDFGCTFIGEGARQIPEGIGRRLSREETLEKYREAKEMGLITTIGRFKGDAVALGVKDASRLMTICHCCPCCCVTTSFHLASPELKQTMVKLEGTSVKVNDDLCNGCGACEKACIFRAIEIVDGTARIDDGACKGCGRCATACKKSAMKVIVDNPRYINEAIRLIGSYVDISS